MKTTITIEDIKKFRPMADIDVDRALPHINEAHILDLQPVLGDALYYDFMENFDNSVHPKFADYQKLLLGTTYSFNGYSVTYDGIIPMMCYYALSRIFTNNEVNITAYGNTFKKNEFSDPISDNKFNSVKSELQSIGYRYQTDVTKFLVQNESLYPLYNQGVRAGLKTGGGIPRFFNL